MPEKVKQKKIVKKKKKVAPKNVPIYKYPHDLATKRGVNGLGLFAKVPIKKGDCIIEYVGEIISNADKIFFLSSLKLILEVVSGTLVIQTNIFIV